MSKKQLIYDLRFGYKAIQVLPDNEIIELLDYNLPPSVIRLCYDEITRRRILNLKAKKEKEND